MVCCASKPLFISAPVVVNTIREFVNYGRALSCFKVIEHIVAMQRNATAVTGQGDGTSYRKARSVVFERVAKLYLDPFTQG